MATRGNNNNNNNNHLALHHHHHHQIGSFDPSRAGCSPIFRYFARTSSSSSSSSNSKMLIRHDQEDVPDEEPVSPKVGCMGHIKKNGNSSNRKVSQFRRVFSFSVKGAAKVEDDNSRRGIGIADTMDLPLPVSKRSLSSRSTEINNLWKRRYGSRRRDLDRLDVVQLKLQAEACLRHGFGRTSNLQA